jgi:hypothetical protein
VVDREQANALHDILYKNFSSLFSLRILRNPVNKPEEFYARLVGTLPERAIHCLAVAANLHGYIRHYPPDAKRLKDHVAPCLLQVAIFGPKLVEEDQDRIPMIESLISGGYPVDYMSSPYLKLSMVASAPIMEAFLEWQLKHSDLGSSMTTLALLVLFGPLNMGEDLHLSIIETLVNAGADPSIIVNLDRGRRGDWTIQEFSARFGSLKVLEIFIKHQGFDAGLQLPIYRYAVLGRNHQWNNTIFDVMRSFDRPWTGDEESWADVARGLVLPGISVVLGGNLNPWPSLGPMDLKLSLKN